MCAVEICAVAVRTADGALAVLQATSRPLSKDLLSGAFQEGVQLVVWTDALSNFDGDFLVRRLRPRLSVSAAHDLTAFAMAEHGKSFNSSPYYAMRAARRRNGPSTLQSYYCAELVAVALRR